MSETHNDVPTRLRIHVQGGNAATAQSVIDGLRRGLVDTHRIEEVAFQVDTLSAEVSLDLRLIGIQAATVPEIAARLSEPAGRTRPPSELDQVRAKFAAHTVCNGMRFVDGYSAAIHEVEMINSGAHPNCPRPEVQLARFSYATFARDCRTVERRLGRVPGWRRRAG